MNSQSPLLKTPFNITSNPQFFFESSAHKEAFAVLSYGIQNKKGIILITGEVGMGKTTLCKVLLNRLPSQIKTSLILNPYFSEVQLLQAIVEDFGLNVQKKNRLDMVKQLNTFLVDVSLQGGNAVLIVDEAQNLSMRQLEQVRLLSNLETSEEKLLQIVLVGQPELQEKLKDVSLRQIRQRIVVKYHLSSLTETEVREYVAFRLQKAQSINVDILPESYKVIYDFSKGIPRLINLLCDRALLFGFANERTILDAEVFRVCVEELK